MARALYKEGVVLFKNRHYEAASDKFEQAYRLDPAPVLLYNLGRAQEESGRAPQAIESFALYVKRYPKAEDRATVEQKIRVLEATIYRARLGTVRVQGVPDRSVWRLDGVEIKQKRGRIEMEAGTHLLFIDAPEGPDWRYPMEVAAGTTTTLTYGDTPPENLVIQSEMSGQMIAGLVTLGGALVFAGAGTGWLINSKNDAAAAERRYDTKAGFVKGFVSGRLSESQISKLDELNREIAELNDSAEQSYTFSMVSFGLAAVAAGVGTYLVLTDEPTATIVHAYLSPTTRGIGISGTF